MIEIEYEEQTSENTISIEEALHAVGVVQLLKEEIVSVSDGWIPCEERLPSEGVPVLVCNKDGKVFIRCVNWISRGRVKIPYWSQNSTKIIAWRELPQPYQPKGE